MDMDAQLQSEACSAMRKNRLLKQAVSMQRKVALVAALLNLARSLTLFRGPAWLPAVTAEHHARQEEAQAR